MFDVRQSPRVRTESRLAWRLLAPALAVILLVTLFPLAWTAWESLHVHDLRMPWRGRPFVGLANYAELLGEVRLWAALGHTTAFTAISVSLEITFGLILALILDRVARARALVRTVVLIPWALPTVVSALLWRFMFEDRIGVVNAVLAALHLPGSATVWLADPIAAWVPIIGADVWKTTPFVALVLLAGLQTIDDAIYEAARVDGATGWQRFRYLTLPLLKPVILVALIFRTLDAFRIFDLVYALTGGGPGTATEPVVLYTFDALFQHLRFGYGAASAVLVFGLTLGLAWIYIRMLGIRHRDAAE